MKACFYSVYAEFPNVVVAVSSKKDRDIALNISGLPYYDVVLFESLPPPVFAAALPVALVKETKDRIIDGSVNPFIKYEFCILQLSSCHLKYAALKLCLDSSFIDN